MNYLDFLAKLHERNAGCDLYFEIGCRQGRSLNLSRAKKNIGVDPAFNLTWPLLVPTMVFKQTSDQFFVQTAPKVLDRPIDIAFIDGMHLSEFALRDFINTERYSDGRTVVVLDDVMPYRVEIGSRTRNTSEWTGDIYKLIPILREYRPDLSITVVDVEKKGLMLIQGLDPASTVLADSYAVIEQKLLEHDNPTMNAEELRAMADPVAPNDALARL